MTDSVPSWGTRSAPARLVSSSGQWIQCAIWAAVWVVAYVAGTAAVDVTVNLANDSPLPLLLALLLSLALCAGALGIARIAPGRIGVVLATLLACVMLIAACGYVLAITGGYWHWVGMASAKRGDMSGADRAFSMHQSESRLPGLAIGDGIRLNTAGLVADQSVAENRMLVVVALGQRDYRSVVRFARQGLAAAKAAANTEWEWRFEDLVRIGERRLKK